MNTTINNRHFIDNQARELLDQVLNGNKEELSEQDKVVLIENRQEILQLLNSIFSKDIPYLLKRKKIQDTTRLFWSFKLVGFFEAAEMFHWCEKLCHIEDLENAFGDYFITEELPYLLANTMHQWNVLKDIIEKPDINEYIRLACLEALVFSVVKKRIDRLEITDYFKSLFSRILNGQLDDSVLCTHLVVSCSDLWPGECLEEIRELFGLNLVDEMIISIDSVLEDFSQGKDCCIEKLQQKLQQYNFFESLDKFSDDWDENQSRKFSQMIQVMDQISAKVDRFVEMTNKETDKGSQRNENCSCGSGRKYKKCCMNKPSKEISPQIIIKESMITYDALEESAAMKAIPKDDKKSILAFYHLVADNPKKILKKVPEYIAKYPDIPMLYNFLYAAYCKTGLWREAMKLMKETLQLFPNYLFARVEYALYLLRRGEPEKAHRALGNAETLSELYPERKVFHVTEWNIFSYAMSLYWIQKKDINKAKVYLAIIQKISPNNVVIKNLQKKMKTNIFLNYLEKSKI